MKKNTLIIGAGEAGRMIAKEILDNTKISSHYSLLGFLDDDEKKKSFYGVPVLGKLSDSDTLISRYSVQSVIIAIPSAPRELITETVLKFSNMKLEIRIVPGIFEIIEGNVSWTQIREVKPEDLLGREEVGFDLEELSPFYQDKTVLVTGAGGSIGSQIFRELLKLPIQKIIALGRGENNIHTLMTEHGHDPRMSYIIGDVRDYQKLLFEFRACRPDIIFHAAAHKHVPMMENFPDEAVKNNIIGTYHTALAALESGVSQFVMVSTDKAVRPKSVMGASKRMAEKICLSFNQHKKTHFILTRFGNVLGSRGSVIPTFMKQIEKGGPVTITHPEIERYFMSIPEAARLVIKSASLPQGDIFVLNMGRPIRILELAKNLIRLSGRNEEEIPIVYTGLRKGEKIQEELFHEKEKLTPTRYEKLMILDSESEVFDLNFLDILLNEFQEAAQKIDKAAILLLLKKYLNDFSGDNQ